jgi:predicted enzyme related to lactoylglutathione lyase
MQLRTAVLASLLLGCGAGEKAASADASDLRLDYQSIGLAGVAEEEPGAAFAWYRDVLGLPIGSDSRFELGDGAVFEVLSFGVASGPPKTPAQQSALVAVEVVDLDATASSLEQRDVLFTGGVEKDGDARAIEFTDWEGNRIQIRQLAASGSDFASLPWACVYVANLDASVTWYSETLGLGDAAISGDGTTRRAQLRLKNGAVLELRAGGSASHQPKMPDQQAVTFSLQAPDIDATLSALHERGVAGQRLTDEHASFVDPEGNTLWLTEVAP